MNYRWHIGQVPTDDLNRPLSDRKVFFYVARKSSDQIWASREFTRQEMEELVESLGDSAPEPLKEARKAIREGTRPEIVRSGEADENLLTALGITPPTE